MSPVAGASATGRAPAYRHIESMLAAYHVPPMALIAEVIHGTPIRFSDPARFSFALGGKDGHPFPVPLKPYDESIDVLRRSLDRANCGRTRGLTRRRRLGQRGRWRPLIR